MRAKGETAGAAGSSLRGFWDDLDVLAMGLLEAQEGDRESIARIVIFRKKNVIWTMTE
jgi:hypothetical protein